MTTKPTAQIPHIHWRDGRPRLVPGPRLRRLGFKGRDLKHPTGTWFSFEEACDESARISAEAARRAAQAAEGKRLKPVAPPALSKTLGEVCDAVFDLPEFNGGQTIGKQQKKGLARQTVKGYRLSRDYARRACERLSAIPKMKGINFWNVPVHLFRPEMMQDVLDNVHQAQGLASARATRAFLSMAWTRCAKTQPGTDHALFQKLPRMPTTPGLINPWTVEEFLHMVATADRLGRPELGDMIFYGALHGQRQTDRLTITFVSETATHITVQQSKRGKLVTLKKSPLLQQRMDAARARRARSNVHWPHLFIDEQAGRPWHADGDHYRHVFAEARAAAAATMPSCARLTDQGLRDTCLTWASHAGTDAKVLGYMAGHSDSTFKAMQEKHYVAPDQTRADIAVALIEATIITATDARKEKQG